MFAFSQLINLSYDGWRRQNGTNSTNITLEAHRTKRHRYVLFKTAACQTIDGSKNNYIHFFYGKQDSQQCVIAAKILFILVVFDDLHADVKISSRDGRIQAVVAHRWCDGDIRSTLDQLFQSTHFSKIGYIY